MAADRHPLHHHQTHHDCQSVFSAPAKASLDCVCHRIEGDQSRAVGQNLGPAEEAHEVCRNHDPAAHYGDHNHNSEVAWVVGQGLVEVDLVDRGLAEADPADRGLAEVDLADQILAEGQLVDAGDDHSLAVDDQVVPSSAAVCSTVAYLSVAVVMAVATHQQGKVHLVWEELVQWCPFVQI